MKYYVTLFDSTYIARGLAMYESLNRFHKSDYKLVIIAMDSLCYEFLLQKKMEKVALVPINEFEDEELLSVKESRTKAEYCWTCTAKSILYVFKKYKCELCTYVDADLMFYSTPEVLLEELANDDVMITEHRYTPEYDQTKPSGKYCVQFMCFKNNVNGNRILRWWKEKCLECCTVDFEHGMCGDQKYLDDWTTRFSGVHEMQNLGGGIAPWNVQQYSFIKNKQGVMYKHDTSNEYSPVVFYHFQALQLYDKDVVRLAGSVYKMPDSAISIIYKEYLRTIYYLKEQYKFGKQEDLFLGKEHFRDGTEWLMHEKGYFNFSLFL